MTIRELGGTTAALLALAATLLLGSAAIAGHHEEGETKPAQAQASKVIVIEPADHVMLVGGQRRLDAQVCNQDGSGCKDAGKAKWTVKPKKGLNLRPKNGASSVVEGNKAGTYDVTVKQGKAQGTTTVTINEPPARDAEEADEPLEADEATEPAEVVDLRPVSVPEYPVVVEGKPYAMAFYLCPSGVDLASVTGGADPGLSIAEAAEALVGGGCEPAPPAVVEPDAGFSVLHSLDEALLLLKEEGAEGWSVRFELPDGSSLFPDDWVAYFGPPEEMVELRSLEDFVLEELDADGTALLAEPSDEEEASIAADVGDAILDELLAETPAIGPPTG